MKNRNRNISPGVFRFLLRCILSESGMIKDTAEQDFLPKFEFPVSAALIEPLIRHHLQSQRLSETDIYKTDHFQIGPASFKTFFENDVIRRKEIHDLVRANSDHRILIIKGLQLASFYPASSLREMEDIDLVTAPESGRAIQSWAKMNSWERRNATSLVSPKGLIVDFLKPETELSKRIFETALPSAQIAGAFTPEPVHALMLVALHCAKHRGTRIWRDITDALMLLSRNEISLKKLKHEMRFCEPGQKKLIVAFLEFLRETVQPFGVEIFQELEKKTYPESISRTISHYRAMMETDITEGELMTLDSLMNAWKKKHASKQSHSAGSASTGQRDHGFGQMDGPGNMSRNLQKLQVGYSLLRKLPLKQLRSLLLQGRKLRKAAPVFMDLK